MTRIAVILTPLAAALAFASAASAVPVEKPVVIERAELATESGRESVRARIAEAAHEVCPIVGRRTLWARQRQIACIEEAGRAATEELDRKIAQTSAYRLASSEPR